MSMDADFGTTSRSAQARGSYSNRKRKHMPGGQSWERYSGLA
jgi:hypothetical protein